MQRAAREYARSLRQHRCWLCHGDKLAKRPSPRQLRTLAAGRDGLAQLGGRAPV